MTTNKERKEIETGIITFIMFLFGLTMILLPIISCQKLKEETTQAQYFEGGLVFIMGILMTITAPIMSIITMGLKETLEIYAYASIGILLALILIIILIKADEILTPIITKAIISLGKALCGG